ncbi:MAG: hypothetical protein CL927_02930 [Deltaproteobacteria bacterium]|nr:hypothetical protein [Deltaproteobacteria bacterium]HCH64547.1 hypothetical protein [Deltaproteobacteria bacterium]
MLALSFVLLPGCALFGDPLLGTWKLVEFDEYGPLTNATADGETTTTTTLSGEMVLDTVDGSLLTGTYTETIQTDIVGPAENSSAQARDRTDAEARDESRDEYELDIDGMGDWICMLSGSELDCEDDDFNNVLFERIPENRKD